jgi:hypothetical protein
LKLAARNTTPARMLIIAVIFRLRVGSWFVIEHLLQES